MTSTKETPSIENLYHLDGKISVKQAVPFGLQHILAMFVSNIAPIFIVAGASELSSQDTAMLIQSAMLIAGIGTLIQLFPIFHKVGSGLPIVMGISFTFVSVFTYLGVAYGYNAIVGAVIVGGIIEGILGLLAKYCRDRYRLFPAFCRSIFFRRWQWQRNIRFRYKLDLRKHHTFMLYPI